MNRSHCFRLAAIGALAIALPLSACGRKGSLDPPPGGMVLEQQGSTDVSPRGAPRPQQRPAYDRDGLPIAPEGQRRRTPLDWLLD